MYKFIKKYNKRLFAIFAAFLMVAFVADFGIRGGNSPTSMVVGEIGDGEKIYADDVQLADREWRLLTQERGFQTQLGTLPLAYLLGWNDMSAIQLMQGRPPYPVVAITQKPLLFMLLKEEARRMGVTVSNDQVNDVMTNAVTPGQRNEEETQLLEQAVRDLLLVDAAFRRAASTIKISEPMKRFEQARQQSMSVKLVEFNAADFAAQVPAPTTQQLEEHFNRFASIAPGPESAQPQSPGTPTTNPFGFGYRFPNRVKLQYIAIPRAEVRKMIDASKTPYEWEVAARKFYQQNPQAFPSTQPAADIDLKATSQPTTRPFEEVKDDAKNRVLLPEVDKKLNEIQSLITSTLNNDYQAFLKATGGKPATTAATQAGNTSLGAAYASYQYLEKLAARIQSQTRILPTVVSLTDEWRGAEQLQALPGIGGSATADGMPFPQYVAAAAEPFVPAGERDSGSALSLWEPSSVLREAGGSALGDVYVFRLTDAQAAHAPKSLDEVKEAVTKDYLAARQLELAKEAAHKLLEAAKQSSLAPAAQQAGKTLITTGAFDGQAQDIAGYPLPPEARPVFIENVFQLLSTPPARPDAKPVHLIELPQAGRVIVAELNDVRLNWTAEQLPQRLAGMNFQIRNELQRFFELEWFNYDDARKRVGFQSELDEEDDAETAAASTL